MCMGLTTLRHNSAKTMHGVCSVAEHESLNTQYHMHMSAPQIKTRKTSFASSNFIMFLWNPIRSERIGKI